ncbi:MAG: hypothetical protein MJ231_00030 [bacterium]|nr:hypothetical protein [bacterium]
MKYDDYDFIAKAEKYGQKYGLKKNNNTRGHNDEVDAFRHAFMQTMLCIRVNEKFSKAIADGTKVSGYYRVYPKG